MQLELLLPSRVFCDIADVSSVVAETAQGSFGILPRRRDCVAALVPGILSYETPRGTTHLAVDAGVLVKTGAKVRVAVRRAIGGADLRQLRAAVEREFLRLDEDERRARAALSKLEVGFLRRLGGLQHVR